jgi:hypothetical protein
MRSAIGRIVINFLIALLLSSFASSFAQSSATTANVTGIITDEQGAAVAGATVVARNLQTNFTREARTETDGSFLISQLPPGSYELKATSEGFVTKSLQLELVLGSTALFNAAMKIGAASEVVEVKADAMVDANKTESSTNIGRDRIDDLPINRRNFLDFSLTAARVTMDRVPSQGVAATSGISINGQQARFNNFTIDGVDNNDNASGSVRSTFSQEAVQEFQVVSDSYSSEFGRAIGGVINIITRTGTNSLHGTIFNYLRNDAISARDVFAANKSEYKQYQFGASLSGPIKKDRIFFFTAFERLSIKQNNIITIADATVASIRRENIQINNGPQPFALDTTTTFARLDAQLTPNDTFWARYNGGFSYNGNFEPFGGLVAQTNSGIQRLRDNSFAFDNTHIFSGHNLVNDTRFIYGRRNQLASPDDLGTLISLIAPEGEDVLGRSSLLPQRRAERLYEIVDNVSITGKRNQMKFGFDFSYLNVPDFLLPFFFGGEAVFTPLNFSELLNMPGLPFFTGLQAFDPTLRTAEQRQFLIGLSQQLAQNQAGFPAGTRLDQLSLPEAYIQGFGQTQQPTNTQFFSIFYQDDIRLRHNLLLKAGLRYDLNRIHDVPKNNGEFSPRLAICYRPDHLQNLTLHASYGLFYAVPLFGPLVAAQLLSSGSIKLAVTPFPFSVFPFALPDHHFPESSQVPSSIQFIPQLSQVDSIAPNLKDSYTQQINVGVDYALGNKTTLSLSYDYIRGLRLFAVRNINPVVRPVPGNALESMLTGRADPTKGSILEFESGFDSYYNALTISLEHRFSNHYSFLAHYTLGKTIDDFLDFRTAIQETNDPLNIRAERALSLQDVRNRFVASGVWDLNYTKNLLLRDFQLSGILSLNSGRPYNLLAGVDLNMNGDNPPGDRPPGLGRNAGISPGFANFDMRLERSIKLNERVNIKGFVEIFNLFNRVNISDFNRTFPPDAQGNFQLPAQDNGRYIVTPDRYRAAFSPRQFQLGLRFAF